MVPGSLRESGISDVVFPGTFEKVPWVILHSHIISGIILVCFGFWKISETICDLWIWELDFRNYFGSSRLHCGLAVDVFYI
ncbi:mucin-7-like [Iris pallida]|uniref:Mucin-7-like n=1 Tax=Iris pallida TaxID=29817 RepID=A0AAX6H6N2_IRIPA|nr:mucin-7-like [Iris pallida]